MIICNTNMSGGAYEIPVTTKPSATIKATGPASVTVKADAEGKATMKLNRTGWYYVGIKGCDSSGGGGVEY